MVYSDRRQAQNVADSAALAAAGKASLALENGGINSANWNCSSGTITSASNTAKNAAISRAAVNSYTLQNTRASGSGVEVSCVNDSSQVDPKYLDITIQISVTTQASFSQIIFNGPLHSKVEAVARIHPRQAVTANFALMALSNCTTRGGSAISISGGDNSGGEDTYPGGIFINSSGSSCCALDPGSSANAGFIRVHDDFTIQNIGSCSYNGNSKIVPNPIQTGYNGGVPLNDPLASLAPPTCTTSGTKTADGSYTPGSWNGSSLGAGIYNPGVYCITGSISLSGKNHMDAANSVLFYFINGGMEFKGQSGLALVAPSPETCTGGVCAYAGIAIYQARGNTSTIEVRGNGSMGIQGLVYTPSGQLMARGGGSAADETIVFGQIIANTVENRGNGSLAVTYTPSYDFSKPTSIDLFK